MMSILLITRKEFEKIYGQNVEKENIQPTPPKMKQNIQPTPPKMKQNYSLFCAGKDN